MEWSKLPPLNALKAFAVMAERGNYSKAGATLNVTHAAINQHVKALENWFGVALVVREGRGMSLTEDGQALAHDLSAGFATILGGVERLATVEDQSTVQVTMSPAFAVRWMMPRIMAFQAQNPNITLMLNPTAEVVELRPGGIDLAIRYSEAGSTVDDRDILLVADMVVVGTPTLIGDNPIDNPSQLIDFPWLQELGTKEVADWMARHGVVITQPLIITHMPGNLIMEAVRRGDGITYTARPWVEREIASGQLVELFPDPALGNFYLETRPGPLRPALKIFMRWLKQQTASTPHD